MERTMVYTGIEAIDNAMAIALKAERRDEKVLKAEHEHYLNSATYVEDQLIATETLDAFLAAHR